MSKAFLREDGDGDEPEDDESSILPPGQKNYMTPRGHAALMAEYERLLDRERPEMVKIVAWAAGNGDRSENGDSLYGKRRLREMDRRIRYLGKRLSTAVVVDPAAQVGCQRVYFGAWVRVLGPDGRQAEYQIVGVDEADAAAGRISWQSPLARALHKAEVGDVVSLRGPGGVADYAVLGIRYHET